MICGYCGYEFEQNEGKRGCGSCAGACHTVHCPRCGYKNPLEPELVKSIKKIFSSGGKKQ